MMTKRKLFRTQALKHYAQNRQKDILPHFISPPVFLLLWILLGIVTTTVIFAWQERVPDYVNKVPGILLVDQSGSTATALLFVPSDPAVNIKAGQPILLQAPVTQQQLFTNTITRVDSSPITADVARTQYNLAGDPLLANPQQSTRIIAVHFNLTSRQTTLVRNGLDVEAQVQIGSRPLLLALTDLLKGSFGG